MNTYYFFSKLGFQHVLDLDGWDHLYFIVVLTLPFGFKDYRKLLYWISLFTFGHTLSLLSLSFINFSVNWVEIIIPISIAVTCIPLIIQFNHTSTFYTRTMGIITFLFGLIHGLGFGRYFSQISIDENPFSNLLFFAIGIEVAQLFIVLLICLFNIIFLNILKVNKVKYEIILGSMVLSQALAITFNNL